MPRMTGGRFIAETFYGYGVTHVFFMPYMIPRALYEMETLGMRRIMAHCEKGAAYMADGYARAGRRAGICMAQSVGAANLAAGLQDARLACSPRRTTCPILRQPRLLAPTWAWLSARTCRLTMRTTLSPMRRRRLRSVSVVLSPRTTT